MPTNSGFRNAEIALAATGTSTDATVVPRKDCGSASVLFLPVLLLLRLVHQLLQHKRKVDGCPQLQDLERVIISMLLLPLITTKEVTVVAASIKAAAVEEEDVMTPEEEVVAVAVVAGEEANLLAGLSLLPMDAVMGTVADFRMLAKRLSQGL